MKSKVTSETVKVTPQMAEEWYLLSGGNRPIRRGHVEFLQKEMRENWALNGEAIIFDSKGRLIDGHHRLVAAAEGELTFETVVVRGVDPDAKATIDTGRSRNQGDALAFQFEGVTSVSSVSTSLMRLLEWERGRLSSPTNVKFSNTEIVAAFKEYPGVETAVKAVTKCKNIIPITRTAWLFYLLHKKHPEKCEEFFERLADGLELTHDHPVWQLRQRLLNARQAGRGKVTMPLNEALAILVKAWNAFFRKKPLKVLRWSANQEDFPKIDGL